MAAAALDAHAGRLVLSERAHCVDEREYERLVSFVSLEELPAAYDRVAASDWRGEQRRAHGGFARRFAPDALFRRARVFQRCAGYHGFSTYHRRQPRRKL